MYQYAYLQLANNSNFSDKLLTKGFDSNLNILRKDKKLN